MRKKERAAIVIERLKKEYPGADCTLDYNEAWKLLVSVRLAAQCTDERVNIIVKDLFAKYPGVNELAEAEPEDIEAIVRPCGLGKSKARDISKCMRMLRDARHAMHDILLLRISAILPEAISDGGLTPPLILICSLQPTEAGVISHLI